MGIGDSRCKVLRSLYSMDRSIVYPSPSCLLSLPLLFSSLLSSPLSSPFPLYTRRQSGQSKGKRETGQARALSRILLSPLLLSTFSSLSIYYKPSKELTSYFLLHSPLYSRLIRTIQRHSIQHFDLRNIIYIHAKLNIYSIYYIYSTRMIPTYHGTYITYSFFFSVYRHTLFPSSSTCLFFINNSSSNHGSRLFTIW